MADPTSIAGHLDRIRGQPKTVTTYGPHAYADLHSFLGRFDVELRHEHLPIPESTGFLTVRSGEEFLGSLPAAAFADLLDPPREDPWDPDVRASGYRDLSSLLAETTFTSVRRPHLLATAREFEDRALRVGRGTLYAGFQSLSAFRAQVRVYRSIADETALTVRVFGEADWAPPESLDLCVHAESAGEIGEFWFVAFDGGGGADKACALIAEEERAGEFRGAWTYDPAAVRDFASYLDETYVGERAGRGDGTDGSAEQNG